MTAKRRRKKTVPGTRKFKIPIIVTAILLLGILSPWLTWLAKPAFPLRALVYDKTVPTKLAQQHANLGWALGHLKLLESDGERFSPDISYRGYQPDTQIIPLDPIPRETDLIYIADTYGIYKRENDIATVLAEGERNLIYGGTDQADVDALRSFLNRDTPNTLIAEYNTFGTPTPDYIQTQLYEMFRAQWTAWAGLYVGDLSPSGDAPPWVFGMYERQYGEPWKFEGGGYILYNTDEEVIVLSLTEDIGKLGNQFSFTEEGSKTFNLAGSYFYNHMFDIVNPLTDGEVLATYTLDVTSKGLEKLQHFGLPRSFPAIIRGEVAAHTTYYLAGNWAYNRSPLKFSFLAGVPSLMRRSVVDSLGSEQSFLWQVYMPLLQSIFHEARERRESSPIPSMPSHTIDEGTAMMSRTHENLLQVWENGQWENLFIHGVNLGIAMPGRWFTDFPKDKALYYRWLMKIGSMGANTLRVYTLLDPEFYAAFLLYNQLNPDRKLYLMQEIWPEEEPHGNDYLALDYQTEYEREIRHVIDAIHGNASIDERRGRAWGTYTSNVAPYVIGYLVGRELEPHEVEATDLLNEGYSYTGEFISATEAATPTEAWLAASTDYVVSYEESTYGWQHPVAIVNWPTLDPIDHPSERNESGEKIKESNDRITVDINHLVPGPKLLAGLFGAYHIYPNYPDFMNNDPLYDLYEDEFGRFRYGGYLREFMQHHTAYPAVVAEFGLATGMGNAHASPDGYHHGAMTEKEQGDGIIRMFEAMRREGYAGGVIFEWMDEWAKKTWTTEPYMIPYDRHILWHNAIDPEQNYGILSYEAIKSARASASHGGTGAIEKVELRLDASFLHIDVIFNQTPDLEKERLIIGIDTYDRERGELLYDPSIDIEAPSGMEYLVTIDSIERARLLAIPPSDGSKYRFSTHEGLVRTGTFVDMAKLTNKARALADGTPIPAIEEDSSKLLYGEMLGSTNHWIIEGKRLTLRIPWTRINVSDPSSGTVLHDRGTYFTDPLRDELHVTESEGIGISALLVQHKTGTILGTFATEQPTMLPWNHWNQPTYRERLKTSYEILQDYLASDGEH